jgi:molybdopterin molybdotransferase
MLTPTEAAKLIALHAPRLPIAPVALRDAAGHVLRQDIVAERDQPPFDRVAMDGIAISSASASREFRIAGTQAAGKSPLTLAKQSECIEAMTGAMLPIGCDCVIPVERITIHEGRARLADDVVPTPWQNLHRRGVDCLAGAQILNSGMKLGAPEIAAIAAAGFVHVKVTRTPRIVVISTGDELVEPGKPLEAWQIRRSNVYAVMATLRTHGFMRVADDHLADDEAQLRARLRKHLDESDVLILSGGVSMGKFDFVPKILDELGVKQIFHKIAQRPGKPIWFGVRDSTAVYALPGNPVSTLACMARYVIPGLDAALGASREPQNVELTDPATVLPSMTTLLPVRLLKSAAQVRAQPQPTHGSGDFTSLIRADGCVELAPGTDAVPAGAVVKFYQW